jgi:hypothetical protein
MSQLSSHGSDDHSAWLQVSCARKGPTLVLRLGKKQGSEEMQLSLQITGSVSEDLASLRHNIFGKSVCIMTFADFSLSLYSKQ